MLKTFSYRTEIKSKELIHTIYAENIEQSIKKWIDKIVDLKDEVYSFEENQVSKIINEYNSKKIILNQLGETKFISYFIADEPQITYIDIIERGLPDFIAKIYFNTTEDGGRKNYASSGYKPTFKIKGKKEMTSAEQIFIGREKVCPGETVLSEIRILWIETFEGLLFEQMKFQLREGANIVAIGEIVEVINKKLKKSSR